MTLKLPGPLGTGERRVKGQNIHTLLEAAEGDLEKGDSPERVARRYARPAFECGALTELTRLVDSYGEGSARLALYDEVLPWLDSSPAPARRGAVISYSLGDLLVKGIPEPGWLVDRVLPRGCTLLTGAPKIGKSLVALSVAVSVASGVPLFGRFEIACPGAVAYVSGEDGWRRIAARAKPIASALGVDPREVGLRIFPPQGLLLDQDGDRREELRGGLESLDPVLLIVDPTIRLHTGNENSAADAAAFLGWLRQLSEELDCAVLIVRHDRKLQDGDASRRAGERTRGSGDWYAWADCTWGASLGVHRDGHLECGLSIEAKDAGGQLEGTVAVTWQGGAMLFGWRSGSTGDPALAQTKATVLQALEQAGGSLPSQRKVQGAVGGAAANVRRALQELEREGQIQQVPGERNAKGYALCRSASEAVKGSENTLFEGVRRTASTESDEVTASTASECVGSTRDGSASRRDAPSQSSATATKALDTVEPKPVQEEQDQPGGSSICRGCGGGMPRGRDLCSTCRHVQGKPLKQ